MISRLSHAILYVTDYDQAIDFYTNILGFKLVGDSPISPEMRWITIAAPDQPDLEIVLTVPKPGMMTQEQADVLLRALQSGAICGGIIHSTDIDSDYATLKSKGVQFHSEPKHEFYGRDAVFSDPFGNWFDLVQTKAH